MKKYIIFTLTFLACGVVWASEEDTTSASFYEKKYKEYFDVANAQRDSIAGYYYLIKYNAVAKHKVDMKPVATALLKSTYRYHDEEKLNAVIDMTQDMPELNAEAKRIRDQIAYSRCEQSRNTELYREFVKKYPDAVQADMARQYVDQQDYATVVKSGDVERLRAYIASCSDESYKKKAETELDKAVFRKALSANTEEAYSAYIEEFSDGAYVRSAKSKLQQVTYDRYVSEGRISDLMQYLSSHDSTDANYDAVFQKLKLRAYENYSLDAMKMADSIRPDDEYLTQFIKRYIADLYPQHITAVKATFPRMAAETYMTEAEKKAETISHLQTKKTLTLEDYTKNKTLFRDLNADAAAKVFKKFYDLNSQSAKSKKVNFSLAGDAHYMQLRAAEDREMNFVLTERGEDYDVTPVATPDVRVFSKASEDGYDTKEGAKDEDIYAEITENGQTKTILLPKPLNSRYNETHPVLSKDMKTMWFSSDRSLNFGGLDIYVSHREDVSDWDSWSEPVLLGEDFNTQEDDYIIKVEDSLVILSQDASFDRSNNIYLEGSTNFAFTSGTLSASGMNTPERTKILLLDGKSYEVKNIIHPNSKGFYSFLSAPGHSDLLTISRKNYYAPLTGGELKVYYIEEMVAKSTLITLASPFEEGTTVLTEEGKLSVTYLARAMQDLPYKLTIGVHALKDTRKSTAKELSDMQAQALVKYLSVCGLDSDRIITTAYGADSVVQGWENRDSIDISLINE